MTGADRSTDTEKKQEFVAQPPHPQPKKIDKKLRIWEKLNLSTNADIRTKTILEKLYDFFEREKGCVIQ